MTRSFVALAALGAALACGGSRGGSDTLPGFDPGGYDILNIDWGTDGLSPFDPGPDSRPCTGPQDCPPDRPACDGLHGVCVECQSDFQCPKGPCIDFACHPEFACAPKRKTCEQNTAVVCADDGSLQTKTPCGDKVCFEGACMVCQPKSVNCPSLNVAQVCKDDGSGWIETQCGDKRCVNGQCMTCVPGHKVCEGTKVLQCQLDAETFAEVEDCQTESTGKLCWLGMCIQLCELNAKFHTNQGCEYWAVDMDQFKGLDPSSNGADSPYALVVSNTNAAYTATVTVSTADKVVKTISAPPKTATPIFLDPLNLVGSFKGKRAYRLTSNLPVVAYQFNPLENVHVFSNDASLLLPTNVLGRKYRVLAWPTMPLLNDAGQTLASNFVVVAATPGTTTVTVRVTAKTAGSTSLKSLGKGGTETYTLEQFEVLNFEAIDAFGDLTGSTVEADKGVAVFAGHSCATAPVSLCKNGKCTYDPSVSCYSDASCPMINACDHLEEQIQPLAAWGKRYVVVRTQPRGKAPDVVRVLANEDDTHVAVSPAVTTVPVLAAGQFHEFEILEDVEIVGDRPILVGQYMEGQNAPHAQHENCINNGGMGLCDGSSFLGCVCVEEGGGGSFKQCKKESDCTPDDANIGDPSFVVGVPVEQFRLEYVFLVPPKYTNNFVNIVASAGAKVTLDGSEIPAGQFSATPSGLYATLKRPLPAGSHTLSSDLPVGIVVYGWDMYVSYAYPGGMNAETLKVDQ